MTRAVTLITGSRKGIGRFLAEHYVSIGHTVVGCSRSESDLSSERYVHFCVDVGDEREVKKMFGWVRRELGHLENLINNAGVASLNHCLLTPVTTVTDVFSTNVVGTFLGCREAAKIMKKNSFGRIVNFTSVALPLRLEGEAVYAASKAAVLTLTQVLANELAEFGITVNSIGPTPTRTDLIAAVPDEKIKSLLDRQAIPRLGTFEDVVNVVDFFLSKESGFVTGQNIYLGGV